MLYDALVLLVIALVATLLGFGGIAGDFAMIGKVLCGLFLILFILSLIISGIRHPIG